MMTSEGGGGGKGHRIPEDTAGSWGFETGDFVKEMLGGATVERLGVALFLAEMVSE